MTDTQFAILFQYLTSITTIIVPLIIKEIHPIKAVKKLWSEWRNSRLLEEIVAKFEKPLNDNPQYAKLTARQKVYTIFTQFFDGQKVVVGALESFDEYKSIYQLLLNLHILKATNGNQVYWVDQTMLTNLITYYSFDWDS